jgi:hypothetical protein
MISIRSMLQMLPAEFGTIAFISGTALCIDGDADQQYSWQQGFNIFAQPLVRPKGQLKSYQPFSSLIFRKKN